MAGYIKAISSLLLVYIISLNTTDWNRKVELRPRYKRIFEGYGTNSQYKGHGQICLTWGGINGTSILVSLANTKPRCLLYLLRFSSEYKYFFNRYVGIVSRFGVLDGMYDGGTTKDCYSFLSLGVGLEWSYNGTGGDSRINKTYYGGSIGVLGLWGDTIDDNRNKFAFKPKEWGVQVRLTPFKMCKPNGLYMSVDFGGLDIKGLMDNRLTWYESAIIDATFCNTAFNIGWSGEYERIVRRYKYIKGLCKMVIRVVKEYEYEYEG